MKAIVAAVALAGLSVPLSAQTVHSALGDWSSIPTLRLSKLNLISAEVPEAMQQLVKNGECQLNGVSRRAVEMSVPFLIRFSASGQVEEVIVRKLGCTKAEAILGASIVKLAQAGTLKLSATNGTGWYRSELNFSYS